MTPKEIPAHWECPRCKSQDIYFAKRQVGQLGGFKVFDPEEGIVGGSAGRVVENDVALCRECGERANKIPKRFEYSPEEQKVKDEKDRKYDVKLGSLLLIPASLFLIYMGSQTGMIYSLVGVLLGLWGVSLLIRRKKSV